MGAVDLYFEGMLTTDGQTVPVSVRHASRYSLWLRFDGKRPKEESATYTKLALQVDGKLVETGPCLVMEESEEKADEFRAVPLRSIYDFEKLFFRSRADVLESAAVNLPLILSYKRRIEPTFVKFVSELTYDLSAHKAVFDEIDANVRDEPPHVRDTLQSGIIGSLGGRFLDYLDGRHETLKQITGVFSDEQHEHHGFYFRKQLWNIILCAPIMARTNLKPRGYIGDSEMMRMIYQEDYQGDTTFGKIMHKHAVGQPAAQAVRNRRLDLAEILRGFMRERLDRASGEPQPIKVLSVACGPAMELNEIIQSDKDCRMLHYSLLDQDRHALLEAAAVVEQIEQRYGTELDTDFIKESVRTVLVTRELQARWGRFDFIYSMGLFDYLTKPVAVAVLKKLYDLLLPGGQMIIGNFSTENPTSIYMAYWMDWTIIYRTVSEMQELIADLDDAAATVQRDATGIQLFLRIQKPARHGANHG